MLSDKYMQMLEVLSEEVYRGDAAFGNTEVKKSVFTYCKVDNDWNIISYYNTPKMAVEVAQLVGIGQIGNVKTYSNPDHAPIECLPTCSRLMKAMGQWYGLQTLNERLEVRAWDARNPT